VIGPVMKVISSREFNQDVSQAKRAARIAPLFITDRGKPTHVLLSIADWRRMNGEKETIVDLLAMPRIAGLDADQLRSAGAWDGAAGSAG
jgi:prevent-host-death family protein